MIFNENLDKSLFLILKNDKKNRKDIIRLLKNMPNDFYSNILYTLNRCEDDVEVEYNNAYKNFKYILKIAEIDKILISMEDKIIGDKLELLLSSLDLTNENIEIGSFSIKNNKKKHNDVIEFEKKYNYSVFNIPKEPVFIKIKEEKIPKDLSLKYINDKFDKKRK